MCAPRGTARLRDREFCWEGAVEGNVVKQPRGEERKMGKIFSPMLHMENTP